MLQLFFIYILLLIISVFFLRRWIFFTSSNTHNQNPPPSPTKLPLIGNFHQIGLSRHRSLHSLSQRHGPLMLLHLGKLPLLLVSSSEAAREIMRTHDLNFVNRPKSTVGERLLYNKKDLTTAPYGDYWRQLRSVCVLHLLSSRKVQSFRKLREEEVALCLDNIEDLCSKSLPVNLSEVLSSLTNDMVCRAAFGRKYRGDENKGKKFQELLRDMMRLLAGSSIGEIVPWLRWIDVLTGFDAQVNRVAKEFDEFLDQVLDDHLHGQNRDSADGCDESEEGKDFVDVMLQIQKDNLAGSSFDRDSIKALILDMFVGGTDTTSTVLEWAMTELLRHPRVMKQLQNEVRQIANNKTYVNEQDLENMHYLKAVLKEVLRLYPPVPLLLPRVSSNDAKIKGYDISAGTTVIVNAWSIGRDPTIWEEAEEFKPERFLNNSIDFKGHDFEFIPFGAGRRGCPGIAFAVATGELVLANIVRRFDWSLPSGIRVEELDMSECSGVIHRKVPLLAVAIPVSY